MLEAAVYVEVREFLAVAVVVLGLPAVVELPVVAEWLDQQVLLVGLVEVAVAVAILVEEAVAEQQLDPQEEDQEQIVAAVVVESILES